jgi:5'-3' exonuclease
MMCSLVGNDFLPHLPSLEIWESAIDRLVQLYKTMLHLPTTTGGGGWLTTEGGDICLERLKMIMSELGKVEYQIFKDRQASE